MREFIREYVPDFIKSLIRRVLYNIRWDQWQQCSWAQEGEDLILKRVFSDKKDGFYVDVGAHHPQRYSNTYLFYKAGWRGINIDAMPGSMRAFRKHRKRDINLEMGVGAVATELDYYMFNEPALNGFSAALSEQRAQADNRFRIISTRKIQVLPLAEILEAHLPAGQQIDFLTVDVEGLDLDVLKSNDWNRYRPEYVLVEVLKSSLHEVEGSDVGCFMRERGYEVYAKCMNTVIFKSMS